MQIYTKIWGDSKLLVGSVSELVVCKLLKGCFFFQLKRYLLFRKVRLFALFYCLVPH